VELRLRAESKAGHTAEEPGSRQLHAASGASEAATADRGDVCGCVVSDGARVASSSPPNPPIHLIEISGFRAAHCKQHYVADCLSGDLLSCRAPLALVRLAGACLGGDSGLGRPRVIARGSGGAIAEDRFSPESRFKGIPWVHLFSSFANMPRRCAHRAFVGPWRPKSPTTTDK
jgi:hypothetical protein